MAPPTFPPLARNSSMTDLFQSAGFAHSWSMAPR
jgi:hypothetical protein